jgi:hypothetical protein
MFVNIICISIFSAGARGPVVWALDQGARCLGFDSPTGRVQKPSANSHPTLPLATQQLWVPGGTVKSQ